MLTRCLFPLLAVLLCSACTSTQLTEQERYAKLQKGIKYNSYRKLSKAGIGAAVDTYNFAMERENKPTATKGYVFAVSAFVWSMAMQSEFALADANTALARNDSDKSRYIALATQSLAFYQKGWNSLGDQYTNEAKALLNEGKTERKFETERQISQLVLGSLAMYNGDTVLAQNSFTQLGESIDRPWLADIARAVSLVTGGQFSEALRLMKALSDDDALSSREKQWLNSFSGEIKKLKIKDSPSTKSLYAMVSRFAYGALRKSDKKKDESVDLNQVIESFHNGVDL